VEEPVSNSLAGAVRLSHAHTCQVTPNENESSFHARVEKMIIMLRTFRRFLNKYEGIK
jgi:hypothetical protein